MPSQNMTQLNAIMQDVQRGKIIIINMIIVALENLMAGRESETA
jgi:hypothetical protein